MGCYNHGKIYHDKGQFDQAIAVFTKALELDPQYAAAYTCRAKAYRETRQYDLAIADYTKALEIDPKDAVVYYNLGKTYYDRKSIPKYYDDKDNQSLAAFTKALELDPGYAVAYTARAMVYQKKRQLDHAILDFTKASEIDPRDAQIYTRRGTAYALKEQYDQAVLDYTKVLELNPRDDEASLHRAIAYEESGRIGEAIESYRRFILIETSRGFSEYSESSFAKQRIHELARDSSQKPSLEEQSSMQVAGRVFCDGKPWSFRTVYLVAFPESIEPPKFIAVIYKYEEYLRDPLGENHPSPNRGQSVLFSGRAPFKGIYKSNTNKNGEYVFPQVDPGIYIITLSNPLKSVLKSSIDPKFVVFLYKQMFKLTQAEKTVVLPQTYCARPKSLASPLYDQGIYHHQ